MNPAIINAACTITATALGMFAGWKMASRRIARAEKRAGLAEGHLSLVRLELEMIRTRRHKAAVKGAQTKRATRIQLPKMEVATSNLGAT